MPKRNQIKFDEVIKAINRCDRLRGKLNIIQKKGSAIRFELFNGEKIPEKMWVMHQDKYIHKGDLKKLELNLGITLEELLNS